MSKIKKGESPIHYLKPEEMRELGIKTVNIEDENITTDDLPNLTERTDRLPTPSIEEPDTSVPDPAEATTLAPYPEETTDLFSLAQQEKLNRLADLINQISDRDSKLGELYRRIYDITRGELSQRSTEDELDDAIKLATEQLMKLTGDIIEIEEYSADLPPGGEPIEDERRIKTQVVRQRGALRPDERPTTMTRLPISISEPDLPPHARKKLQDEQRLPLWRRLMKKFLRKNS